jgi:hypothetical protein
MPWLPLYMDEEDAASLLAIVNADPEVAFIVSDGPRKWIARPTLTSPTIGRHCLWHCPSGALPLLREGGPPDAQVTDPWSGWVEAQTGADPSQPYFGAGWPGIIWWNIRSHSRGPQGGIGLSGFEWIGNHYRMIGSAADPKTEAWWAKLRKTVKKLGARRIPREGSVDGVAKEIWALPSALRRIEGGEPRESYPL